MFDVSGVLRTWSTPLFASFDVDLDLECRPLSDHRIAYLDYEGEISGGRGRVERLLRGTYRLTQRDADRMVFDLNWELAGASGEGLATVQIYRSLVETGLRRDDKRGCWRLRFSPGRYDTNR